MDRLRALLFKAYLFSALTASYPLMCLFVLGYTKPNRGIIWNHAINDIFRFGFKLFSIRALIVGRLPSLAHPIIVVANHASLIDGFLVHGLFRNDPSYDRLIPLTAPARDFPFPFNKWGRKTANIEVARDWHDELLYPETETRSEAISWCIKWVENGNSLLIFPEGHYERTGTLHYFHTGAARISIATGAPVCPISISGLDRIIIEGRQLHKGVAKIKVGDTIVPPTHARVSSHASVRQMRDRIEMAIASRLPRRNIPTYKTATCESCIAAFFDIDRTLYLGYSQQDFLHFLMRHHVLPYDTILKAFGWILEEKTGLMKHQELMRRAFGVFRGWKRQRLQSLCQAFFSEYVIAHMYDNMLPYVKDHAEAGHNLVLVTEVVEPLALAFKHFFDMHDALATRVCFEKGICTGNVKVLMCGPEKAAAARHWANKHKIDLAQSYAYADSPSDFHLLHAVGHPTAVRPQHDLLIEAQKRHWTILH